MNIPLMKISESFEIRPTLEIYKVHNDCISILYRAFKISDRSIGFDRSRVNKRQWSLHKSRVSSLAECTVIMHTDDMSSFLGRKRFIGD